MFKKLSQKANLALTLGIIAAISALLLAFVNSVTSPIIEENLEKKTVEAYAEIFPEMDSFDEVKANDVDTIVVVKNKSGDELGIICATNQKNSYGDITALVGFDSEKAVVGIEYSRFNQTPGFGDKVKTDNYINQYVGDSFDGIDADAVSGATYSSKLVNAIVNTCAGEVGDRNDN